MSYDKIIIKAPNLVAAAPLTAPALATGVSSGVVTDQNLQDLDQYVLGGRYKTLLSGLDETGQRSYWDAQMTPQAQAAAKAAGYAPPWEQSVASSATEAVGGVLGGIWGGIKAAGGAVVPDVVRDGIEAAGGTVIPDVARDFVGDVGGYVGGALSWGNDYWKGGYRQGVTYGPDNSLVEKFRTLSPVFSVGGMIDNAFNSNPSENKLGNYDEERLAFAKDSLPPEVYELALDATTNGKTPEDLVKAAADSGDQELLNTTLELVDSGGFDQAMKLVGGAQVSYGRDFASILGLTPDQESFQNISGIEDGMATIFADPTLVLGPVGKGVQAARLGIHTPAGIAKMEAGITKSLYWKGVSEHLTTINTATDPAAKEAAYSALRTNYSQTSLLLPSMVKNKVSTLEEIRDHISNGEALAQICAGRPGVKVPLMPYRSWVGEKARELVDKGRVLSKAESAVYAKSLKMDVSAVMDDADDALVSATENIIKSRNSIAGRAVTFMNRPFDKVPQMKRIEFNAADAHEDVYKLARMAMPRFWANQTSVAFLEANTEGKRSLLLGLMETMGEVTGITKTAAGREAWARKTGEMFGDEGNYAARLTKSTESPVPSGSAWAGGPSLYHGSSRTITDDMLDGSYSYGRVGDQARNLIGPGFYTTEDVGVAGSYTKKGAPVDAAVHGVTWRGATPPRLMDLDQPVSEDFILAVRSSLNTYMDAESLRGKTGMAAYKEIKEALEDYGMSASDADETTFGLSAALENLGWDGFAHVGGRYASKSGTPHNVKVFFDQSKLSVSRVEKETDVSWTEPDRLSDGTRGAIFTHQNNDFINIPDFRELYQASVRLAILEQTERSSLLTRGVRNTGRAFIHPAEAIGRIVTTHAFDVYTEDFWKPGVLLRPALPVRNSGEETVNFIARESSVAYARGVSGARILMEKEEQRRARVIMSALDEEAQTAVKAGDRRSLAKGWLKAKANSGRTGARKILFDEDDNRYFDELVDDGEFRSAYREIEESTDQRALTSNQKMERANDPLRKVGSGGSHVVVQRGAFKEAPTGDLDGAVKWAMYNTNIANDPEGLIALENIGDRATAVQKLVEWADSPSGSYMRDTNRLLNDVGAQEWAERVYDVTKQSFSHRDGTVIPDMVRQAINDGEINARWIDENLIPEVRPEFTSGRDISFGGAGDGGWAGIQNLITKGFGLSEHWTAKVSRHPMFASNYLRHRKGMAAGEKILAGKMGEKAASKLMVRKAREAAYRDLMEYSDNPLVRSQFAVIMRNVFPFWRAQEEFYIRWAKTGVYNPYAFRKMQLTMMGMENAGVIERDQEGHQYFSYPIFGEASNAVMQAASKLGIDAYIPVPNDLTGQVRFLNQGLDSTNIQPSFGPVPTFLVQGMRVLYPETAGFEKALLGELAAGRNPFVNQLPTMLRRVWDTYGQREANGVQSVAYLEAAGLTPGPNATPQEIQLFKERVQNNAVGIGLMKALFGAFAPSSPNAVDKAPVAADAWREAGVASVSDEFWSLVSSTGNYEMAMAAWIKVHPDLLPFTVSKTNTPSGAIVSATAESGEFIAQNKDFMEKYPSAAPYWLVSKDGEFDGDTWQLMLAMGMKEQKTFDEYYADLKAGPGIEQYYDAREKHEAYQLTADPVSAAAEQDRYGAWSETFLLQNPLVKDYLAEGGARANDRLNIVREMTSAINDPNTPQTPMTQMAGQMLQAYNAHIAWRSLNDGLDDASVAARQAEATRYQEYMAGLSADDAGATMLYNRLFRYME